MVEKEYKYTISEKYSLFKFFIKCAFRVFRNPKYSAQIFADHFQCEFKRAIRNAAGDILNGQVIAANKKPSDSVEKDTKIKLNGL